MTTGTHNVHSDVKRLHRRVIKVTVLDVYDQKVKSLSYRGLMLLGW